MTNTHTTQRKIIGMILAAVSAASFATLATFGRWLIAAGMDTFSIMFLRFGIAALIMFMWMAIRREPLPSTTNALKLIGMGAIGYVGQSFSYLSAVQYASSGLVALILYLYPSMVAALSMIFLKEKLTPLKLIALIVALIGTGLTVSPEGGQWLGIAFALSAAAIYSIYIIVGAGVLKQVSPIQSSAIIFASAGSIYGVLTLANGSHFPITISGWINIAALILIATIIPVVTFLAGIERIGPVNASMLSTLEPIVTVILGAILFQEILSPISLFGGSLILIAVIMIARSELRS
jgi:drug/metabolite transporter (DMT)-like permease